MNSDNFKIAGVTRNTIYIEILDPTQFDGQFNIGSYIKIPYQESSSNFIIGVIENYKIKNLDSDDPQTDHNEPSFIIEVKLIGSYTDKEGTFIFERGAHGIPLPPNNGILTLSDGDLNNIFSQN